jgi:CYTH domain-containing protein
MRWKMTAQLKYAKVERERRFLVERFPSDAVVVRTRCIRDRYIEGSRLRLREQLDDDGPPVFKLTQKIPQRAAGAQQGFLTTMYLSEQEFRIFAQLPAKELSKIRYSVPPFGIDVFEGTLAGLIIAEAEFDSAEAAIALEIPSFIGAEVSVDGRFTGGRLVHASRDEWVAWVAEYGFGLADART